ncbi:hypothetical protein NIES4072_17020 [Nostoc commune NIES-4072]|uniref:Uncharacterized protein n=1 Tax=Nostoc commune NIES-4072 TaxID=2005467 RepID=A0A2R5FKS0_NOSCO|nr:hypothetical protein NIES4070_09790 [Nostoc commune HK-02]GBG18038.1 hypothetical protein NIES4072_17020 [Nostoc commune NIES-4072]
MTSATNQSTALTPFPDHTQLPESDGTFVFAERAEGKNWQEHPQSLLLTDSITPVLKQINPEGQYCIGQERAEQERQRAEQESQRADHLAAQLRSLGVEPEL